MLKTHLRAITKLGLAVSLVLTSVELPAETLEDVREAIQEKRFEQAYRSLETLAQTGDSEAQCLLSKLYRRGQGRQRDEYRAFEWCRQAAEAGLPEAQLQVGLMYLHGEGVTADDAKAVNWISKAADAGNEQATALLDYVLNNDFTYGC